MDASNTFGTHRILHWKSMGSPIDKNICKDPIQSVMLKFILFCRIFLRALFHIHGSKDIEYVQTTSNEVATTKVDPLIDLIPRPLLKVTRVGLQMANLTWTLDDTADQKLIKGYRIVLNSKPTEILSSDQHEYELTGLKPGGAFR